VGEPSLITRKTVFQRTHVYCKQIQENFGRNQRGFKDTEHKPLDRHYLGVTHSTNEFRSSDPRANQYYGSHCVQLLLKGTHD
jgi:hypothetical protein